MSEGHIASRAHEHISRGQDAVVRVTISHDPSIGWSASSDDLPGFRAIESSRESLIEVCRDMIAATFSADCGIEVDVKDAAAHHHAFIATPKTEVTHR